MIDGPNTITAEVASRAGNLEGVSVLVVTPSETVARVVAPSLADRLYPGRSHGIAIHAEWMAHEGGWEVVVRDLGPCVIV